MPVAFLYSIIMYPDTNIHSPLSILHQKQKVELCPMHIIRKAGESISLVDDSDNKPTMVILSKDKKLYHRLSVVLNNQYHLKSIDEKELLVSKVLTIMPDVVIVGGVSANETMLEWCQNLKQNILSSYIPWVVMNDTYDTDFKIKCLDAGVDLIIDYSSPDRLLEKQLSNLLKNRRKLQKYYTNDFSFTKSINPNSSDEQFLTRIRQTVEKNYSNPEYNVTELVTDLGISRSNLYTRLKALTGQSTSEYMRSIRLKKGAVLLKQGHLNVSEVAYMIGLKDPKYFSKKFKKLFGITPSLFQKGDVSKACKISLSWESEDFVSPKTPA